MPPNAVSELALLNSGQVIPAEFWPGHESYFLDNDRHRPWWERKTGDVLENGNENEFTLTPLDLLTDYEERTWGEKLELWEEMSLREEKRDLQRKSSDKFRDEAGVYGIRFRPPRDYALNSNWQPYVTSEQSAQRAITDIQRLQLEKTPISFVGGNILHFAKRTFFNAHQSHGWRGRKSQKFHPVYVPGGGPIPNKRTLQKLYAPLVVKQ